MPWLCLYVLRTLTGEGFRKATPKELRWFSGSFAFTPIWMALFLHLGHRYLDSANAVGIWFFAMGVILVVILWLEVWAKLVSANVSWCLGGIVWAAALWFALNGRI